MSKWFGRRGLFISGGIAFWILRIYYWLITKEIPFSDMADYNSIALKILHNLDFSHDSFWQSYQSPGLPALRAIQMAFLGQSLIGWQIFQTLILFLGLVWLVYEVRKQTKSWWLSLSLLWIVALSKSSIFWSYKIATEGIVEAFSYLAIASTLFSLRMRKRSAFFLTGIVYAILLLIRPNFFIITPLFIFMFIIQSLYSKNVISKKKIQETFVLLGFFSLGIFLLWSPWLFRSYSLYKHIVPFNTHGAYTFLWEIGNVEVKMNNKIVRTSVQDLQNEAPKKFSNDYAAYTYAEGIVSKWLSKNFNQYDDLFIKRLYSSSVKRDIYLTKVSRIQLYPNVVNNILIDKSVLFILLGFIGLLVLTIQFKYFYIFVIIGIAPWLGSLLALGYPRMFEPSIPIVIFGSMACLLVLEKGIKRLKIIRNI